MKKNNLLLRLVKRIFSNRILNPIALKVVSMLAAYFPKTSLNKVPVVGKVRFHYKFDCEIFYLFSNGDDSIVSEHYFSSTGFESASMEIFVALSKTTKNILDIGANTGVYSIAAAVNSRQSCVYAFEPVPRIFNRLNYNIKLNNLVNVHTESLLISDQKGEQKLYIPNGAITTSASSSKGFRACKEVISVDALTVDDFVERNELSSVGLMKIDTESTEPSVLKGALKTIKKKRPIILCEVLYGVTESRLHSVMDGLNYHYFWVCRDGLIEMKTIVGDAEYLFRNYIFVADEKVTLIEKFIA